MSAKDRTGSSLSGWCASGYCLPGPITQGCPGTFELAPDCTCTCHRGDVPDRAVRTRAAQDDWVEQGSLPDQGGVPEPEVA